MIEAATTAIPTMSVGPETLKHSPLFFLTGVGIGSALLGKILEVSGSPHLKPWIDLTAWVLGGCLAITYVWDTLGAIWNRVVVANILLGG